MMLEERKRVVLPPRFSPPRARTLTGLHRARTAAVRATHAARQTVATVRSAWTSPSLEEAGSARKRASPASAPTPTSSHTSTTRLRPRTRRR